MKKLALSIVLVLSGCTEKDGLLQNHCFYVSPFRDEGYCGTTIIEIMANPSLFDGQLVTVRGWVVREGDVIMLFPLPEYAERGFSNSSILISGGKVANDLRRDLPASSDVAAPQRVTLSGRFVSLRSRQTSSDVPRLGILENVASMMP